VSVSSGQGTRLAGWRAREGVPAKLGVYATVTLACNVPFLGRGFSVCLRRAIFPGARVFFVGGGARVKDVLDFSCAVP